MDVIQQYTRSNLANSGYTLESNLRIFTCVVEKVNRDGIPIFNVSILRTHSVTNFFSIDLPDITDTTGEEMRLLCQKVLYEVATGNLCPDIGDLVICDCDVYYNRTPAEGSTGIHRDSIAQGSHINQRDSPEFVSLEYFLPGGYFLGPEAFVLPYRFSGQSTYRDDEFLSHRRAYQEQFPGFLRENSIRSLRLAVSDGSVIMFSNENIVHATPSRDGSSSVIPSRGTEPIYLSPVRRSFLRTWFKQIPSRDSRVIWDQLRGSLRYESVMQISVDSAPVAVFDGTYNYKDPNVVHLLRGGLNNNHEINFKIESNLFKLSFDHPLEDISNPEKYIEEEREKIKEIISLLTEMKNNKKMDDKKIEFNKMDDKMNDKKIEFNKMDDIKMNAGLRKHSRKHKRKNSRKNSRKHKRKNSRKYKRKNSRK
jgi:hypothetical protein